GLQYPDVFYFGNSPGETGESSTNALVNAADEIGTRNHQRTLTNPAPIDFPYDFNGDGFVNAGDQITARTYRDTFLTALRLIDVPLTSTPPAVISIFDGETDLSQSQTVVDFSETPVGEPILRTLS